MTGEELRNKLFVSKVEIKGLAEKLGVSPQSLSQIFSAADVKSGWLERIATALGKDMSFFYPIKSDTTINNNVHTQRAKNIANGSSSINENASLENVVMRLMDELAALSKENRELRNKQ